MEILIVSVENKTFSRMLLLEGSQCTWVQLHKNWTLLHELLSYLNLMLLYWFSYYYLLKYTLNSGWTISLPIIARPHGGCCLLGVRYFSPSFPGLLFDVLVSSGIVSKNGHSVIQIFLEADNILFLDLCGSSIDVLALWKFIDLYILFLHWIIFKFKTYL